LKYNDIYQNCPKCCYFEFEDDQCAKTSLGEKVELEGASGDVYEITIFEEIPVEGEAAAVLVSDET
jgi:hypothetical protein